MAEIIIMGTSSVNNCLSNGGFYGIDFGSRKSLHGRIQNISLSRTIKD